MIAVFGIGFALFLPSAGDGFRLVERDGGWYHPQPGNGQLVPVTPGRVIDGDTFEAKLAGATTLVVRIFGVNTPERGERCADEATERLIALAADRVLLMADERLSEGGRELRYVFTSDGRSIDAALIAEGLAEAWRSDGALRDQLVEIQETARSTSTGCLWSGG